MLGRAVAQGEHLRSTSWPGLRIVLPAVVKKLHYRRAVDGLIIVADSNGSKSLPGTAPARTERMAELEDLLARTMATLQPVVGMPELKTAIGMAVPAIEAWYLFGKEGAVSEAAWINGRRSGKKPYDSQWLKLRAYGTDRP